MLESRLAQAQVTQNQDRAIYEIGFSPHTMAASATYNGDGAMEYGSKDGVFHSHTSHTPHTPTRNRDMQRPSMLYRIAVAFLKLIARSLIALGGGMCVEGREN